LLTSSGGEDPARESAVSERKKKACAGLITASRKGRKKKNGPLEKGKNLGKKKKESLVNRANHGRTGPFVKNFSGRKRKCRAVHQSLRKPGGGRDEKISEKKEGGAPNAHGGKSWGRKDSCLLAKGGKQADKKGESSREKGPVPAPSFGGKRGWDPILIQRGGKNGHTSTLYRVS